LKKIWSASCKDLSRLTASQASQRSKFGQFEHLYLIPKIVWLQTSQYAACWISFATSGFASTRIWRSKLPWEIAALNASVYSKSDVMVT